MAIYHLSVKTISRSAGRSATGAAAYRAGEKILDERTGAVHDYHRKSVESTDLVLPADAPEWASDRAALWNTAEQAETRKNSTVAREFEIALPAELSAEERRRLAVDFAREIVARHGCAADVAIHPPGQAGDTRNYHAHILVSTRRLTPEGFTEKTRELDERKTGEVERWRERFAGLQNERLREAGAHTRVDHRTLEAQGIAREPTQHKGPAVAGMERRGKFSEVGRRMAEEANARLFAARETGRIERELAEAERSLIDLSGDLAKARAERDRRPSAEEVEKGKAEARQAYERFKAERGAERTGPAVNASRFMGKPPEEAQARREAEGATLRPDFEAMPIEQQAKAFDLMHKHLAQGREAKLNRVIRKASVRHERRSQTVWELREAKPKPPTGLLASFHRPGYETALGQWQKDQREAERLKTQAEKTYHKISYETLYYRIYETWAQRVLKRTEPALTRRVAAYKAEKREQERQEWERTQLEREFKSMALMRAMKAFGYQDTSEDWQATPKLLREIIDDYNRRPKEQQERALAAWMRDPEKFKAIAALIAQRREHTRDHDRSL